MPLVLDKRRGNLADTLEKETRPKFKEMDKQINHEMHNTGYYSYTTREGNYNPRWFRFGVKGRHDAYSPIACRETVLGVLAREPRNTNIVFYACYHGTRDGLIASKINRVLKVFTAFDSMLKEVGSYKIYRTKYPAILKFKFSRRFRTCPQLISALLTMAKNGSSSRRETLDWLYEKGSFIPMMKDKHCAWDRWKRTYGFTSSAAGIVNYKRRLVQREIAEQRKARIIETRTTRTEGV